MTPREFSNIAEGIQRARQIDFRTSWEQTRSLMFSITAPHLKNKNAGPQDIILFPWEKNCVQIDLNAEIEAVESQKSFWDDIDNRKKALN